MTNLEKKILAGPYKKGALARYCGCSREMFRRYMTGESRMPATVLLVLADKLEVDPKDLMPVKEVEDEVCV